MQATQQENMTLIQENPIDDAVRWARARTPVWLLYPVQLLYAIFAYLLSGKAVVSLVRKLISWAGYISESALIVAVIWVTINNVAHQLLAYVLPGSWFAPINYVSIVAFSVLPELILGNAIIVTYNHWRVFFKAKSWKNAGWVWGVLYILPTGFFLGMTVSTLLSFVQVMAVSGVSPQATGVSLSIRLASGYYYAMLEFVFVAIGRPGYAETFARLRFLADSLRADIKSLSVGLQKQSTDYEARILALQSTIDSQSTELETLRDRLVDYESRQARRLARQSTTIVDSHETPLQARATGSMSIDDGSTLTMTDGRTTVTFTGTTRDQVLIAMKERMVNNQAFTNETIAEATGLGLSTVKKYSREVREEILRSITGEMPPIPSR